MVKAERVAVDGGTGLLLSGGCDVDGAVPLDPFLPLVPRIQSLGLKVNLHPGLADGKRADAILDSGPDSISLDVLQDEAVMKAMGLRRTASDYALAVERLAAGPLTPHVLVGLQAKEAEDRTLDLISKYDVRSVVALSLMPRPRTGSGLPQFIHDAAESTGAPVLVGCMRPRGRWQEELECLEAGASGIVNPSARAVAEAELIGIKMKTRRECCSLHL